MCVPALLISPALPGPGVPPPCNAMSCIGTVSAGRGPQQELHRWQSVMKMSITLSTLKT